LNSLLIDGRFDISYNTTQRKRIDHVRNT